LGESGTHIDDFRLFIIEQQRRVQLVRGHYEYGLHENMRLPYTYMTLLRDPIDRAVSWYYFIKEDPECPNYKNYVAKSEGFADFTRKGFGGENSMTETLLSGEQKKTASNDWERLEMARENLRRDFSVIGFLEKFDEAIVLFKRESGWN